MQVHLLSPTRLIKDLLICKRLNLENFSTRIDDKTNLSVSQVIVADVNYRCPKTV